MAKLILVRHCQSSGQRPDAALTDDGEADAAALAGRLAALSPDAVYSSPYRRAVTTVLPFALRAGLAIREDERLRERELSPEPLDDWLDHIQRSYEDIDHRAAPGGETLRDAQTRALAAIADIAAAGHRLPVAASHGNLISAVLRAADDRFGFDEWRELRNPDLFEVTLLDGRPVAFARID
ncbi:MAG TPA: histidine phosphatase family protein [Caulobacteraceae bacterium]|nr:histidine phosphatase family protein [Caulobacteraceae bacterium]